MLASSAAAATRWYRRRRPAIARGFLIALAVTILFLWFVEPATLAHRLIRSPALPPDAAYVSRMVTTDARAGAPDVLVLGGSATRDVLPFDPSARLSAHCGRDTYLFNAGTSAQHPADSRAIVDALARPPALIVVGLTYRRLSLSRWADPWRLEQQQVALPRSGRDFLAAIGGAKLDGGVFDSLAQLRRMRWEWELFVAAVRGVPMTVRPDLRHATDLESQTPKSHAQKQLIADTMWILKHTDLERSGDAMADYWIAFAREMQARGSRVAFLMTPYSREAEAVSSGLVAQARGPLEKIARAFPVIDLRGRKLRDDAFRDPLHLTPAGRDRLWPVLSAEIARHGGCTRII